MERAQRVSHLDNAYVLSQSSLVRLPFPPAPPRPHPSAHRIPISFRTSPAFVRKSLKHASFYPLVTLVPSRSFRYNRLYETYGSDTP